MNDGWSIKKAVAGPLGLVTRAPEGDKETVVEGLGFVHQIDDFGRFVNSGDRAVLRESHSGNRKSKHADQALKLGLEWVVLQYGEGH